MGNLGSPPSASAPISQLSPSGPVPGNSYERILLAAFLSPLLPGLGHLLLNRKLKAMLLFLLFLGLLGVCWPLRLLSDLGPTVFLVFGVIALCIFAAYDAPYGGRNKPSQWWLAALLPFALLVATGHVNWAMRAAGFQVFEVPSRSMENTVPMGTRVIVDRWYYSEKPPENGDLVIYINAQGLYLMKRLIARGGETIESRNGKVWRNGQALSEPYAVHTGYPLPEMNDFGPLIVPQGKLFVMGDNRDVSLDSRNSEIGPIDVAFLRGKALYTIASFKDRNWNDLH